MMNKSNNHRETYYKIILVLLIISICLNIYLYNIETRLTKDNLNTNDYLRYVIVLKLDRQSDIFYKLSNFTNQINGRYREFFNYFYQGVFL